MSYTSIDTCENCGKKIVIVNQAIGEHCTLVMCSGCAKRRPHVHDQRALENKLGVRESMIIGTKVVNIKIPR